MLEVIDLVYNYDGKPLLEGINFRVGEDEVLCLLGPSGGGKSTILRIIAGLEKPLGGKVLFNGKDLANVPVHKRNFGLVFQDYALFPHLSVYENIAFGLKMKGENTTDIDSKVKNILRQVGMEAFAERKVTDLSGGEQQRVALARSLVVRPSLLMLDEPLGALDYSLRRSLIGELKDLLGKNGIPAIYVTHDQNEATSLADRIAILHDGKILQTDTPEGLFSHPDSQWMASFLGFTNYISGTGTKDGRILVHNFGRDVLIEGEKPAAEGKAYDVLLKKCRVKTPHIAGIFELDAVPTQNIFRGDNYKITLLIDDNVSIQIRNEQLLPDGEKVRLCCRREDIIIYEKY